MRRHLVLSLVILSALASTTLFSAAQIGRSAGPVGPPPQELPPQGGDRARPPTSTITVATQLVQVDVVVQDSAGRPVHGLTQADFQIAEDKKQQGIKNFEEHISVDPMHAKIAPAVKLGPGMFTDYTPVPQNAPLTVILLDRLNTPMVAQTYVLQQLREFLKKVDPNSRVAIFGLTSRLIMLQGFTDDPRVLLYALDHNGRQQASVLLNDPGVQNLSDALTGEAGAPDDPELRQFEADNASFQTQLQVGYTLTAFDQLAAYLSGFPGRKNVLWLSGSFPINIDPDTSVQYSMQTEADFGDKFKKTVNLLARARIAVYPVDAIGLDIANHSMDASQSFSRAPTIAQIADTKGSLATNQGHNTMDQLASQTGGKAFYNQNDLVGAFTQSIQSGSDYYTLTYSPSNHDPRGGFRSIHVQLLGDANSRSLKLAYRRGYYLDDSRHATSISAKSSTGAPGPAPDPHALAVMQHGAPAPSEILFKIRVLPAAKSTEDTTPGPDAGRPLPSLNGPLARYEIDFTTLAGKIDIPMEPDGHHHGAIEFVTFVYDGEGKLLDTQNQTMHFNLKPEDYDKLLKGGIGYSQQVTTPAHAKSLRIAVHDLVSGRLGVVEVPLAAVSKLDPAS